MPTVVQRSVTEVTGAVSEVKTVVITKIVSNLMKETGH